MMNSSIKVNEIASTVSISSERIHNNNLTQSVKKVWRLKTPNKGLAIQINAKHRVLKKHKD